MFGEVQAYFNALCDKWEQALKLRDTFQAEKIAREIESLGADYDEDQGEWVLSDKVFGDD